MERIKSGQRAALYVRVSTEEQVMHGISLGAQRDRLLQFAEENNLIVVDIYEDEGISARKKYTKRPEMCRMLADVQKGLIDIIIFIKLDRWFRNVADFYEVQQILDKNNVNWIATEEDYDTTTANGRLHLNIKLSIAQDEADRTSERIKFVIAAKKARGEEWSVSHSIGFKIVDKKLVVDNETAPIVRTVFEEYLKGIDGIMQVDMDISGTVTGEYVVEEAVQGSSVVLTIDSNIQSIAEESLKNNIENLINVGNKTIEEVINDAHEMHICLIDEKLERFKLEKGYVYDRVKAIKYSEFQKLYEYLEGKTPFSTQHKTKGAEFDNVLVILDNGGWNNYNFESVFVDNGKSETVKSRSLKIFYVCCTRAKENLAIFYHMPSANVIAKAQEWFGADNIIKL